jgi:hypothetical protein
METEYDLSQEMEIYEEYEQKENFDAFIDELAMRYCGDVYIVGVK